MKIYLVSLIIIIFTMLFQAIPSAAGDKSVDIYDDVGHLEYLDRIFEFDDEYSDIWYIKFDGDRIYWELRIYDDDKNYVTQIKMYNITTGSILNITEPNPYLLDYDVSDNYLVTSSEKYSIDENGNYSVDYSKLVLTDLRTGFEETIFNSNRTGISSPRIFGNNIIYEIYNYSINWTIEEYIIHEHNLMLYNIETRTEKVIINKSFGNNWRIESDRTFNQLNDNYVIIPDYNNTNNLLQLYLYEIKTDTLEKIYETVNTNYINIGIYGSSIIWERSNFYYDLDNNVLIDIGNSTPNHIEAVHENIIISKKYLSVYDDEIDPVYHRYFWIEVLDLASKQAGYFLVSKAENDQISDIGFYNDSLFFVNSNYELGYYQLLSYDLYHDTDSDTIPDHLDDDADNDGFNNTVEFELYADPFSDLSMPLDLDNDKIPDRSDDDLDNDGVLNENDDLPYDPERSVLEEKDDEGLEQFYNINEFVWVAISLAAIFLYNRLLRYVRTRIMDPVENSFFGKMKTRKRNLFAVGIFHLAFFGLINLIFLIIIITISFIVGILLMIAIMVIAMVSNIVFMEEQKSLVKSHYKAFENKGFRLQSSSMTYTVLILFVFESTYFINEFLDPIAIFSFLLIGVYAYTIGDSVFKMKEPPEDTVERFIKRNLKIGTGVVLIGITGAIFGFYYITTIYSDDIIFEIVGNPFINYLFGLILMITFIMISGLGFVRIGVALNKRWEIAEKGLLEGRLIKRYRKLSISILGKETTNRLLLSSGLPLKLGYYKLHQIRDFVKFIRLIEKGSKGKIHDIHRETIRLIISSYPVPILLKYIGRHALMDRTLQWCLMILRKGRWVFELRGNEVDIVYNVLENEPELGKIFMALISELLYKQKVAHSIELVESEISEQGTYFKYLLKFD